MVLHDGAALLSLKSRGTGEGREWEPSAASFRIWGLPCMRCYNQINMPFFTDRNEIHEAEKFWPRSRVVVGVK
jgi:hypothetical protein